MISDKGPLGLSAWNCLGGLRRQRPSRSSSAALPLSFAEPDRDKDGEEAALP